MVLMREASPAMRAARFFSSGCAGTMPSTFFWFGQIRNQTLNHMIVPSHMPMPIVGVMRVVIADAELDRAQQIAVHARRG